MGKTRSHTINKSYFQQTSKFNVHLTTPLRLLGFVVPQTPSYEVKFQTSLQSWTATSPPDAATWRPKRNTTLSLTLAHWLHYVTR